MSFIWLRISDWLIVFDANLARRAIRARVYHFNFVRNWNVSNTSKLLVVKCNDTYKNNESSGVHELCTILPQRCRMTIDVFKVLLLLCWIATITSQLTSTVHPGEISPPVWDSFLACLGSATSGSKCRVMMNGCIYNEIPQREYQDMRAYTHRHQHAQQSGHLVPRPCSVRSAIATQIF